MQHSSSVVPRVRCVKWGITVNKPKMVSLALLLLTVSTLATLCNALPTELHHKCEGSALCHIKPDGYPQEEIDRMVLKHLAHLPRMKRETQLEWEPAYPEQTGNCATRRNERRLFTVENKKGALPDVIVQSKWFNQTITEVQCAEDDHDGISTSGCLSAFTTMTMRTKCETKYMHFDLIAYDILNKKIVPSSAKIGVDCACVVAE